VSVPRGVGSGLRAAAGTLFVLGLVACAGMPQATNPPPADPASPAAVAALEERLRGLMTELHGTGGIYVRHLPSGATVAINAQDTFPTASTIKLPLLVTLFDQVEQGRLRLDERRTLEDAGVVQRDGDDIVALGMTLELRRLAFLMMAASDNTASVWIQELVGGAAAVNRWLEAHGFDVLRNNSRHEPRREFHRRWGWGQTTPQELAELLVMVRQGRAVSRAASEEMYRLMSGSFWYGEALAGVPPHVAVASKQGWLSRSRSEVLLVHSPGGDYVLAVLTKDHPPDMARMDDHPGTLLLRRASWEVYRHFNPGDGWRPAWLP
jgi:beta-lactamase class A